MGREARRSALLVVALVLLAGCTGPKDDPAAPANEDTLDTAAAPQGSPATGGASPPPTPSDDEPLPTITQPPRPLEESAVLPERRPYVVVATLDTGANLLHPTWDRADATFHPSLVIDGYPADAPALATSREGGFAARLGASNDWANLSRFSWLPGTNIIGTWAHATDERPVFDVAALADDEAPRHAHGAAASSQIAGERYSLAPEAYLVVMDRTPDGSSTTNVFSANAEALRWAADQPWIDIIHVNIQTPLPYVADDTIAGGVSAAVAYAVSKGKLVVVAGGNFYALPTEQSPHTGPRGALVAGANDNCGYTDFTNPDPHVVMDGYETVAAAADSDKDVSFSGTSSASPRTAGYAASLLLEARRHFAITTGMTDGKLIALPEGVTPPAAGPLADGDLTAAELHEVIRKTADPVPHASKLDGDQSQTGCIPQPAPLPASFYPKMGYGEVSEHTLPQALDVLRGIIAMPERPVEDAYYERSEALRDTLWP